MTYDTIINDLDGNVGADPDVPFALFAAWLAEATKTEPVDANAMTLATATPDGLPSTRIVLLKGLDEAGQPHRGFVFYTNLESRKGRELGANPRAALLFYWKSLGRQVRIEGTAEAVADAEADAYYRSRPRGSRIGAWASRQSQPLPDRAELEQRVAEVEQRFGPDDIPRPPFWSGFRIVPTRIEFWRERPFRLHDRLVYQRQGEGWRAERLYP